MKKISGVKLLIILVSASLLPACTQAAIAPFETSIPAPTPVSLLPTKSEPPNSPSSIPSPTPPIDYTDVAPKIGELDPGTYTVENFDEAGFNLRFTVPSGWTWSGWYLSKGDVDLPSGAEIFFFGGPMIQVHADPCHWAEEQENSDYYLVGRSAVDLIASLVAQPMDIEKTPTIRYANVLGYNNRWPGMTVELTAPEDLNLANCDDGQYRRWGPEINAQSHVVPGQRDFVWAVEIPGAGIMNTPPPPGGLIIDASSFPGTPADVMSEIASILDSIVVGHWG